MNDMLREELATIIAEELAVLPDKDTLIDLPMLIQSPRARAVRRISEIANSRGWQIEVARVLDRYHASYVDDLTDDAVIALRDRMEYFEECVQCACDPDDAPPAR